MYRGEERCRRPRGRSSTSISGLIPRSSSVPKRCLLAAATETETEAVDRALDLAISEYERSRLALDANQKFLKSGIVIRDAFGTLAE